MGKEQATYRPPNAGERIPHHTHGDLTVAGMLGFMFSFMFGLAALVAIGLGFAGMNLRADRDRDVICAAAVKYPEFTLNDCLDQESVQRKELQQKIDELQKALERIGK